jgi:hypothetical protein
VLIKPIGFSAVNYNSTSLPSDSIWSEFRSVLVCGLCQKFVGIVDRLSFTRFVTTMAYFSDRTSTSPKHSARRIGVAALSPIQSHIVSRDERLEKDISKMNLQMTDSTDFITAHITSTVPIRPGKQSNAHAADRVNHVFAEPKLATQKTMRLRLNVTEDDLRVILQSNKKVDRTAKAQMAMQNKPTMADKMKSNHPQFENVLYKSRRKCLKEILPHLPPPAAGNYEPDGFKGLGAQCKAPNTGRQCKAPFQLPPMELPGVRNGGRRTKFEAGAFSFQETIQVAKTARPCASAAA